MDEQNEQPEVIEQEEEQIIEEQDEELESQEEESNDVTLSKSEFKKLQRKAIAYDATKETKETKTAKPTEKTDLSSYEVKLEKLELRADGYTSDEIDAIQELGGAKALSNPLVQSAIKAMRAEKKSQDAKEPLNSKSPVFKKFTQQDLSKMSASEMEKILQE